MKVSQSTGVEGKIGWIGSGGRFDRERKDKEEKKKGKK